MQLMTYVEFYWKYSSVHNVMLALGLERSSSLFSLVRQRAKLPLGGQRYSRYVWHLHDLGNQLWPVGEGFQGHLHHRTPKN